jgi:hypothetical protein
MNEVDVATAAAMAKLAGIKIAVTSALNEDIGFGRGAHRSPSSFDPETVKQYFNGADLQIQTLQANLPVLYGDFQHSINEPETQMSTDPRKFYSRRQMERLVRGIDQIFEIRANSELGQPKQIATTHRRVFITHGHSSDWREVQSYIERDLKFHTMELAQESSQGMTIIEKLFSGAERCDSAVIVMTGDDLDEHKQARSRENVMHEIGFFQGKYGRSKVCLLHEDGVSIPTNLTGVVYIPYTKGSVSSTFHVLLRELNSIYSI